MKKLLISLSAILAAMPMMASAADVQADPGATTPGAAVASAAPKYGLMPVQSEVDGVVATAGYVKGAYNAAIKGINKVSEVLDSATSALTSANNRLTSAIEDMDANYATQSGVNATLSAATANGTFSSASFEGTFTSAAVTGTISATPTATIATVSTWGAASADSSASVAATLTNGTVEGYANGTVAGTASGAISGSISGAYING